MVLNNVTKFHKILIKSIRVRERMSLDRRMYVSTDGRTGVALNAPAIVMAGHKELVLYIQTRLQLMVHHGKYLLFNLWP